MNKEYNDINKSVKTKLSEFLGVDVEDIEDDFSLSEELHMTPADLTDFIQILSEMKFNVENLDFSEIETFSDLIEALTLNQ